jgi:flagellar motor switch protein FliM
MKDLLNLKVGDVIELDRNIDSPVIVQVANKKQFYGRVGKSGKHLGVQVSGVYREQDDIQTTY